MPNSVAAAKERDAKKRDEVNKYSVYFYATANHMLVCIFCLSKITPVLKFHRTHRWVVAETRREEGGEARSGCGSKGKRRQPHEQLGQQQRRPFADLHACVYARMPRPPPPPPQYITKVYRPYPVGFVRISICRMQTSLGMTGARKQEKQQKVTLLSIPLLGV